MRITVPVQVRWADLDAYGHINNAAMFTILEEARVAVFWNGRHLPGEVEVGQDPSRDHASFVVHQEIEYLAPLGFAREPLAIQMWISRIGTSSAEVSYEIPGAGGEVAARARTTVVMVDAATGRPRRITTAERAVLEGISAEPLVFRHGR